MVMDTQIVLINCNLNYYNIRNFYMAEYILTFLYYCPVWVFFLLEVLGVVVMLIAHYMVLKIIKRRQKVARVIIILSIAMIIWITLLTRKTYSSQIDLIPFHFVFVAREHTHILRAAFMNIVLYIPFGYGMAEYVSVKRNKRTIIIIYAAVLSSSTEIFQYLLALGYTEVDDIVLNTFGTMIGMFVQKWMNKILPK